TRGDQTLVRATSRPSAANPAELWRPKGILGDKGILGPWRKSRHDRRPGKPEQPKPRLLSVEIRRQGDAKLKLPAATFDRWLLAGIAVLVLAGLSLALRPDSTVFMKPLSEDGYYSLAVARSIAAGHGVTIDGVTPTNGFQPLLTFVQAGLFAVAGG